MADDGDLAPLVRAIEASRDGWSGPRLEAQVFGVGGAAEVAMVFDQLCRTHLGAPIVGARRYHASVGATAVVDLVDGRAVAVKAYQPRWTRAFLAAVVHVQGHLVADGFPGPRPLVGPVPLPDPSPGSPLGSPLGFATIDEALPEAVAPDGSSTATAPDRDEDRAASAAGLARLVILAAPLVGSPAVAALATHPLHLPGPAGGPGWGPPHSPLFDFDLPTPEAEAIDDLAAVARAQRDDPGPPVIAHSDWAARNVTLVGGHLAAVFDWDSLLLGAESTAVGQAGLTWDDDGVGDQACPDAVDVAAFVADYERHRGRPFTAAQRRSAGAAALYTLCYRARCEAALAARWPDVPHSRAGLDRLAADDDALLRLDELLR